MDVCANCGNTDSATLWDEEDTFYCSNCFHRTSRETGEDDLVECPACGYMRDRKALHCRHCNSSWGAEISDEEYAANRKLLQDEFGYD